MPSVMEKKAEEVGRGGLIDGAGVRAQYEDPKTVAYYSRAVSGVGLWRSEEKIFVKTFTPEDSLLDLGCGSGRIAIGLWELGYRRLLGVDFSAPMVAEARRLARLLDYGIAFRRGDATRLTLDDEVFDGVIFGFNGLMQIPGRESRRKALTEVRRVLRPGGNFVFTTHDRRLGKFLGFWEEEAKAWVNGPPVVGLGEFGDRLIVTEQGPVFMHIPEREEVLEDLAAAGLEWIEDHWRQDLANETAPVRAFSDECRFWVCRRP
ncbi:MAG: class I SAM-dependent methyltransferase [Puniceicoccaceae bacterium]|nr:MAG: class I SAM-dependent methyltransferase [Puniceicoccaceae bacterium]